MQAALGLMMAIAIPSQIAHAQKTGSPTGSGTNSGTASSRTTTGVSPSAAGAWNGNVYLTGIVMLDDGVPPPVPATIERVCNGAPRAEGYTDLKGRFSFQVGDSSDVMQDASEDDSNQAGRSGQPVTGSAGVAGAPPQSSPAKMRLDNCDLRAVLAGFRSDTISLAGRHLMDDPNVGTIVLHRLVDVEGTVVSVTSLQAPKDARRAYEKAHQYMRKNNLADAADELLKAVNIYPKYAAAWFDLGMIQAQFQDEVKARQSFTNAVAADPKFIGPYPPLIELAAIAKNWVELADITSRLLKLDPVDYPMAYFYHATANMHLGQVDVAEQSVRAGQKLDTTHQYPKLEQLLAMILWRKKDYAGALEHLRTYLQLVPDGKDTARTKKEIAELERLSGVNQQANAASAGVDDPPGGGQPGPP